MRPILLTAVLATFAPDALHAQALSPLRFKQERDGASLVVLTPSELATLGDPLFNLVLKDKANLIKLANVEAAIQPDASQRRFFVVDERIVSSAKAGSRRSVISFVGNNGGEELAANVMLSVSFGPSGITATPDIEAWGWDNQRQRYNYYKLDQIGSVTGDPIWKFRASSDKAELLSADERRGTCLACHIVGAPVMKELFFPWNNWNAGVGGSFKADYLDPNSPVPDKWPAASTPEFQRLTGADALEDDFFLPALKRFALVRLNSALKRDDATGNPSIGPTGQMTVTGARRLLRPLFETIDVNLYTSRNDSGIHPFGKPTDFQPAATINMPADQFFLNTTLIAGAGEGALGGLKIAAGRGFVEFAKLTQQENKDLVTKFHILLNGVLGDTKFAWIVPGPSFSDNALIDRCLNLGVVSPHFLAAALAVDVENPVFSAKRASLIPFVPDNFDFTPVASGVDPTSLARDVTSDQLTRAVLANIDNANPPLGSPADEFRTLLRSADATKELEARVAAYVARVKAKLETVPGNAANRNAELERLFHILNDRRNTMEIHPILGNLDETGGRLLLPSQPAPP